MVFVWIIIGLVGLFSIGLAVSAWGAGEDVIAALGLGVFVSAFVFGIGSEVVWKNSDHKEDRVLSSIELAALTNDSEMQGTFFLGSGTIDETDVYNYVTRDTDGAYRLESINVRSVRVYQDNNETPRIETTGTCVQMQPNWEACKKDYETAIYIPEGSIWQGYDIDVRNE